MPIKSNGLKEVNTKKYSSSLEKLVCIYCRMICKYFTSNKWSSGEEKLLPMQRSDLQTSAGTDIFFGYDNN